MKRSIIFFMVGFLFTVVVCAINELGGYYLMTTDATMAQKIILFDQMPRIIIFSSMFGVLAALGSKLYDVNSKTANFIKSFIFFFFTTFFMKLTGIISGRWGLHALEPTPIEMMFPHMLWMFIVSAILSSFCFKAEEEFDPKLFHRPFKSLEKSDILILILIGVVMFAMLVMVVIHIIPAFRN